MRTLRGSSRLLTGSRSLGTIGSTMQSLSRRTLQPHNSYYNIGPSGIHGSSASRSGFSSFRSMPSTSRHTANWVRTKEKMTHICTISTISMLLEYWLSSLKVATIVVFVIVGVFVNLGANRHHEFIGTKYWYIDGAPFVGGFGGFAKVFVTASFACKWCFSIRLSETIFVDMPTTYQMAERKVLV